MRVFPQNVCEAGVDVRQVVAKSERHGEVVSDVSSNVCGDEWGYVGPEQQQYDAFSVFRSDLLQKQALPWQQTRTV